ncbi:JmjC domain-containing protein [Caldimonas sp. KR1-144]|uniref:JmjC domain-containing protein n=1 Tax=Caldimonas sp. KR1-144 TaxID=3400911 RepID=UPI003C0305C2
MPSPKKRRAGSSALNMATPLLGGLSPQTFMRRHWHKRPLLIRGAVDVAHPFVDRRMLFELAAREDVESRVVEQGGRHGWKLKHGPFEKRALPPVSRAGWTLLVQGLDLQLDAAHALLQRFRFVPEARLDDLMVSWASNGGGVGPHFDSYDVFLIQLAGRRRWRVGRLADPQLVPDVPLKILANFEAEEEWLLEPGDMLYLPPRWAHDGVAEGECLTASVGFRAPARGELAQSLVERLLDAHDDDAPARYRDPAQPATATPGRIPASLGRFARDAVRALLADRDALDIAFGEWASEPKPNVVFEPGADLDATRALVLDRRTRMLYDSRHVYVNGEGWRAAGADAALMRRLADGRRLEAAQWRTASRGARELLQRWAADGWLHAATDDEPGAEHEPVTERPRRRAR